MTSRRLSAVVTIKPSIACFGALARGIGSSEAEHAMATGVLRLARPQSMRVTFSGALAPGVTAKDMALALFAGHGAGGGAGHAIEFAGEAVAALDMDARMTAATDLVDAMGGRESIVEQINRVIPLQMLALQKQFPTMTIESHRIIENSLREEFMNGVDMLLGRIAGTYAHRFTTDEMRSMAHFNRSNAGRSG